MAAAAQNSTKMPSAARAIACLGRGVWIQAKRRNAVWVMIILLCLYGLAAGISRIVGTEGEQADRFLRSLGLELAALLGAILTIVFAGRLVPEEIEQRTIYPVLAKPISRGVFLLGKLLPAFLLGAGTVTLFGAVTLIVTRAQPYQSYVALFEAWWLQVCAMAMLTALVGFLSLKMPAAVAMLVAAAFFFGGGFLPAILEQAHASWFSDIIPNCGLLNQVGRYVDGGAALEIFMMLKLTIYALCWTTILGAAAWVNLECEAL